MTAHTTFPEAEELRKAEKDCHDTYVSLFGRILVAAPELFSEEDSLDNLKTLLDTLAKYGTVLAKTQMLKELAQAVGTPSPEEMSNLVISRQKNFQRMEDLLNLLLVSMNLTKKRRTVIASAFDHFREAHKRLGYAQINGDLLHTIDTMEF